MFAIVPFPVHEIEAAPGPKYSMTAFVPPFTVRMPHRRRMTSFGDAQPESVPLSLTPMSRGTSPPRNPAMTSTASAPPTPDANIPRPPAFGVCESVPIIMPPGKA